MSRILVRQRPPRLQARRFPETVSEKPKPKRGRPPAWHSRCAVDPVKAIRAGMKPTHDGWAWTIPNPVADVRRTTRGSQDHQLALHAIWTLERHWEPAFAWFWTRLPCSKDENYQHRQTAPHSRGREPVRWTVLAELGRLRDDAAILEAARAMAAWPMKLAARRAVAVLRDYRLGRGAFGTGPRIDVQTEDEIDELVCEREHEACAEHEAIENSGAQARAVAS